VRRAKIPRKALTRTTAQKGNISMINDKTWWTIWIRGGINWGGLPHLRSRRWPPKDESPKLQARDPGRSSVAEQYWRKYLYYQAEKYSMVGQ
jgi:hypothetical protein